MGSIPLLVLSALPALPMGQEELSVPSGFTAELVAEAPEIRWPSALLSLDDGSLLVAEDPMDMVGPADQPIDRILRLAFARDGSHETTVFADGLYAVFGLEQVDDSVLVVNMPHLTRLRDLDGDGRADEREVIVEGLGPQPPGAEGGFNDHAVSGVRLGMDGYLYISVGDKGIPRAVGSDGSEITLRGGGVVRMRPDGTRLEVVATGTRNHLDVVVDERGEMFTYDNTDDGLGWWTRVSHVIEGGYYGYPWDYQEHPERMLPCMTDFGSGSPTGGLAYREAAWPVRYRGSLFWCEWGKQALRRIELEPVGATFRVFADEDFVSAGTVPDFRPTDVCESADGRFLYVSDWGHPGWKDERVTGRLWRLRLARDEAGPGGRSPDLPEDLVERVDALGAPGFRQRLRAQRALAREPSERSIELLVRTLAENPSEVKRRHAIWALVGGGGEAVRPALLKALEHPSEDTQAQAVRALAIHGRSPHEQLVYLLTRGRPRVRREAARALGRVGGAAEAARLAAALQLEDDPFVRWSIRGALRRIGVWDRGVVNWINITSDPGGDLLEAMRGVYDLTAVRRLVLFVSGLEEGLPEDWAERLAGERAHAVSVLGDVHRTAEPWDGIWWGIQPALRAPPVKATLWDGSRPVVMTVRSALEDPAAVVRRAALEAVRDMPGPRVPPLVRELFEREPDPENQLLILGILAALDDGESTALLEGVARDTARPNTVRVAAVQAAGAIGTAPMIGLLRALAQSDDLPFEALALALEALGVAADDPSAPTAEARLAHRSPEVRAAAARALSRIVGARAVGRLVPLLDDRSSEVRLEVIAALGALESAEAVPALLARREDPREAEAVVRALARTPDVRALDAYLAGVVDQATRDVCRAALRQIRDDVRATLEARFTAGELDEVLVEEVRALLSGPRPILDWVVLGPYERDSVQPRFEGGEATFDRAATAPGAALAEPRPLAHRAEPVHGHVDLAQLLSSEPGLEAFAWTEVEGPGEFELTIGSDDMISIWINGELVHDFEGHRAWANDQDRVAVHLDPGPNELLLRVGQGSDDWAFSVALPGERTGPLFDAERSPPSPAVGEYRAFALANAGDSSRGFQLFQDARRMACTRCHSIASSRGRLGDRVGPDLDGIGARYGREDLITSVLEPSLHLADGYRASTIRTTGGEVVFGQVTLESAERIIVVDSGGEPREVRVEDIADRRQSDLSAMPEGMHTLISPQELADLVAFLETLGGGEARSAEERRR